MPNTTLARMAAFPTSDPKERCHAAIQSDNSICHHPTNYRLILLMHAFTHILHHTFARSLILGDGLVAQNQAKTLAPGTFFPIFLVNTRAVPLVRKENAHKGRVFFCPSFEGIEKGAA
jgi:hypothetical protein